MSYKAIFLISVFVFGTYVNSIAQVIDTKADAKTSSFKTEAKNSQNTITFTSGSQNQKQKVIKNQLFIGNDWPKGTILLRDGGIIDNYSFRYNLLADHLEFISGKDTLVFNDPQDLNTVTFGGHTLVYENYQYEDSIRKGYFELLVPGKNKLMLKGIVTGRKPDSRHPENESLTKYKIEEYYFISKPGIPANKLACNRKSALTFLNAHNEDIAEYLRITENKIRTIEDMKLLVSYYNSLDEEY